MSPGAGWKRYQDFVLRIEPAGGGRYRAVAQVPTGGQATALFDLSFEENYLKEFYWRIGHPDRVIRGGRSTDPLFPAMDLGKRLYRAIIREGVRDLFTSACREARRGDSGVRLQLHLLDVPELADLPWEFLHDDRDFLALSHVTPIVRYLDLQDPPRSLRVEPPLRILVSLCLPEGLHWLDAEGERAHIQEALAPLVERGAVQVDFAPDATLHTLQRMLLQARSARSPYHVWHYIGHGAFYEAQRAGGLAFSDRANRIHWVSDTQLGTLFNSYPEIRLVLLNACEGARLDPEDSFSGIAAALVQRGISAVVGMQFEISDAAAKTLSGAFYQALVDGLPLDAALTEARRTVFLADNLFEWATPILYMRAPDGQIFDLSALPPRPGAAESLGRPSEQDGTSTSAALQQRLESLYTEALEAYYAARWVRAVEVLDEIVSLQAGYRRAAPMFEEARRQHELAEGYAQGIAACDARNWNEAIPHLEAVVALDADYRDAADRLQEARHQKELADLYADARQLHQAQRWEAAIQASERIRALEPDYPDPEGLLDSARVALAVEQHANELAALYGQGLEHIEAREWPEALECLEQVAELKAGYRETDALLARVRREREAQERAHKLAALYGQGLEHVDAREWPKALECLEQVAQLEQGYRETDALLARVRQEIASARPDVQPSDLPADRPTTARSGAQPPEMPASQASTIKPSAQPSDLPAYRSSTARPGVQPSDKPASQSRPVWMWVVLGAVALLLLIGGAQGVRYALDRSAARATATSAARATATSAAMATPTPQVGDPRVREKDGAVMVYVPAGEFWMGSKEGEPGVGYDEKPRHKVFVDAFWIDRTEVTNAQYRQCVEAKVCSSPGPGFSSSLTRENYYGNPEYDDYPVIGVTWDRAREYAAWVGGRLPTEAEWEYACRGPGESTYSWGNPPPDESLLNYNGNVGDTTKVGSYPGGESWCGALDVGGNVWEWTQSLYQGYPYDPADGREDLGADGSRVLRGGAYYSGADAVRCGRRDMADIRVGDGSVGFRVVVSPG